MTRFDLILVSVLSFAVGWAACYDLLYKPVKRNRDRLLDWAENMVAFVEEHMKNTEQKP